MKHRRVLLRMSQIVAVAICAAAAMLSTGSMAKEPPVIPLPYATVEPPRDVAAESWKSPYCAHWNDGCTECTRASKDETPKCGEETDAGRSEAVLSGGGCKRRAIICFKEMDTTYFDRICEGFMTERYSKSKNGAIISEGYWLDVEWHFDGKKFISEHKSRYDETPNYYLLSDNGYINLSSPLMKNLIENYQPRVPIFAPNSHGLFCGKSFELWGPQ